MKSGVYNLHKPCLRLLLCRACTGANGGPYADILGTRGLGEEAAFSVFKRIILQEREEPDIHATGIASSTLEDFRQDN